jgi:hypothetical protein
MSKNASLCSVEGCENHRATAGTQPNGNTIYRRVCREHHYKIRDVQKEELAINEGYANATERRNALHPYRWALKTYCENVDSRLGFRCTTTIMLSSQLEVDHIDGNPSNNEGENLQTLCGCCHTYKTLTEKDYLTPGRKALGLSY